MLTNSFSFTFLQCVTNGNIESEFLLVTKGVPHSSVLVPALFTVNINSINVVCFLTVECIIRLYDDTIIYFFFEESVQLDFGNFHHALNALQNLINLKLILDANKKFINILHLLTLEGSHRYKYFGI